MEPLTREYAEKHKLTGVGLVKYFNPDWSDEQCDYYLCEFTCFPFSIEITIQQLNEKSIK